MVDQDLEEMGLNLRVVMVVGREVKVRSTQAVI